MLRAWGDGFSPLGLIILSRSRSPKHLLTSGPELLKYGVRSLGEGLGPI